VKRVRGAAPGPLPVERSALAHAEAVLLVDDAHRQTPKLDVGLDQRVGAHDHRELAGAEQPERLAPARCGRRAGQQGERDGLFREQRAHGGGVLLRERLGRRHERRLVAGLDRAEHRV
jgi:hypothetical protein